MLVSIRQEWRDTTLRVNGNSAQRIGSRLKSCGGRLKTDGLLLEFKTEKKFLDLFAIAIRRFL